MRHRSNNLKELKTRAAAKLGGGGYFRRTSLMQALILLLPLIWLACSNDRDPQKIRPRQLQDVPAQRLAYTFRPDTDAPPDIAPDENTKLAAIQQDFDARRTDDVLIRTVASPDGQRALALYSTTAESGPSFHIDLYAADGKFLRNLTPPNLAGVFPDSVLWSGDGERIAFIGRRNQMPAPSPTPLDDIPELPSASPLPVAAPSPSVAPAFGLIALFNTEQIYLCNRDGFDLKPLTTREGLIYFALSWAPNGQTLAALACKESEWEAREREYKTPAGRPRLISVDGKERLLDDMLAEAPPVWSPDSSKIATAFSPPAETAFEVDIGIYDAASKAPTQARIHLRGQLLAASAAFDERPSTSTPKTPSPLRTSRAPQPTPTPTPQINAVPASYNPIVRLEWPVPEKLYVETAYVSVRSEIIKTWSRWHQLTLSPQAAVLSR